MDNLPANAPLEARFQLNDQDLREKMKLAAMHTETRHNNAVNPLALLTLIFAPAYALWAPLLIPSLRAPSAAPLTVILNVLVPQFIFAMVLFYLALVVFKARQKQRAFSEPNRVTLDTNGATQYITHRATSVQWRGIRRVVATNDTLGLLFGAGEGFIVPRRAFDSDDDWQRYVGFAQQHWQKTQSVLPPIANA